MEASAPPVSCGTFVGEEKQTLGEKIVFHQDVNKVQSNWREAAQLNLRSHHLDNLLNGKVLLGEVSRLRERGVVVVTGGLSAVW